MGRAYEVRKASIQKTGAAKAKLYSMYAREIYQLAKTGGTDTDSNLSLKRLLEKAKKDQIPSDIIKRAIDKVNSGISENYDNVRYEIFGPAGSTLIVDCLTDNVNRTISHIKTALNKTGTKMGVNGSVAYAYDNLCIVQFKGHDEEAILEGLIEENIDIDDIETGDDNITIYGKPEDLYHIKQVVNKIVPDVVFDIDEIAMLPKEKIKLSGEDLEIFNKLLTMLDDIEDVSEVYNNVEL